MKYNVQLIECADEAKRKIGVLWVQDNGSIGTFPTIAFVEQSLSGVCPCPIKKRKNEAGYRVINAQSRHLAV
jgi:hypothetical protein